MAKKTKKTVKAKKAGIKRKKTAKKSVAKRKVARTKPAHSQARERRRSTGIDLSESMAGSPGAARTCAAERL